MKATLWRAWLIAGLALVLLDETVLGGTFAGRIASLLLGLAGLAAILIGVRLHRPEHPGFWYFLAAGQAVRLAGLGLVMVALGSPTVERAVHPGFADALYLAAYAQRAAAVLLLLQGRRKRRRGASVDAAIVTVGASLLSWAFLMDPYWDRSGMSLVMKLTAIAPSLGDLVLMGAMVFLVGLSPRRSRSYQFLLAWALLLPVVDTIFVVASLHGWDSAGGVMQAGWMVASVILGTAALHPSMEDLTGQWEPARSSDRPLGTVRLALLTASALAGPAVVIVQHARGFDSDVPLVAAGCIVLTALVLLRLSGLVRELDAHERELSSAMSRLERVETQRRRLFERTVQAVEDERKRTAAELHDGPIQRLAAMTLRQERALRMLDRGEVEGVRESIERVRSGLSEEISVLRTTMSSLRPPALDERGLALALQDYVGAVAEGSGIDCRVEGSIVGRLDPAVETILYRVAQEALMNAIKHAEAGRVRVRIDSPGTSVELRVEDDGVGFDSSRMSDAFAEHMGLFTLQERVEMAGGRWRIDSEAGKGTTIEAVFPLGLEAA